jgi:hypothetical protein
MTTSVQVSQDFQTRLFEKIRTDIGSLMTDDEIKKLVESAIERIFFTERVTKDGYGYQRTTQPPELVEVVKAAVEPKVKEAVQEWIAAHPDEVKRALDQALAGGLAQAVLRAFDTMLSNTMSQVQFNLQESLARALQK